MNERSHLPGSAHADPHDIEDLGEFMTSFMGSTKDMLRAERDHLTFMLAKRTADTTHKITGMLITWALVAIMVIMASIGGAILIGRSFGDPVVGYAVVVGIYAILTVVFMSAWKGAAGKRFIVTLMNSFYGH